MASYTIANESLNFEMLRRVYTYAKSLCPGIDWTDLDYIFNVACAHQDRFPGINLKGNQTPELYIERWVKGYYDAVNNPPSQRIANPKSSCTDPAIKVIVKATQGLSEEAASFGEATHNLFMSAENIQGNLLEEYIASKARPYGFLWCDGNVLRAIDFCNTDGSFFLQIKNKSNTENSSSSNIREGTTIEKWYRLGTRTKGGIKYPDYKWSALNELINAHKTEGFDLSLFNTSEEDYQAFLSDKASSNHGMITNQ